MNGMQVRESLGGQRDRHIHSWVVCSCPTQCRTECQVTQVSLKVWKTGTPVVAEVFKSKGCIIPNSVCASMLQECVCTKIFMPLQHLEFKVILIQIASLSVTCSKTVIEVCFLGDAYHSCWMKSLHFKKAALLKLHFKSANCINYRAAFVKALLVRN